MFRWNDIIQLANQGNPQPPFKVVKSEAEWKAQLTPEQYAVTRLAHTEHPFTGQYCSTFEPGIYHCVCCQTALFDATQKFESGTGWPSFTHPIIDHVLAYVIDTDHDMVRVEVLCHTCDAHLGHVFPDGPPPTGLRYCMNSIALYKADPI